MIILFQGSGMWLCRKWKEAYDCQICCNCYVYNFIVIAFKIVLHHCAQDFSKNCNHPEKGHSLLVAIPSKNRNPTELLLFEN